MQTPIALISGITGQDGSYLTELLLGKGYEVHGIVRRSSNTVRQRLDHLTLDETLYNRRLFLHYADLSDHTAIRRLIKMVGPSEFYHLAGQSHVGLSFEIPESTADFTAMGTLAILEILRDLDNPPRFLNIGSSELFGRPEHWPQSEQTPFRPTSPYGVAKAFAVDMTRVYREAFGLFACSAIAYNHESPRRGASFVTRKIAKSVAEISRGERDVLALGNLDIERDWGYAPEFVDGMYRILQHETADDYILATGRLTSLKTFLEHSFAVIGRNWEDHVIIDPKFVRPAEPAKLVGDPSHAKDQLGWVANIGGGDLAELMVRAELELAGSSQGEAS